MAIKGRTGYLQLIWLQLLQKKLENLIYFKPVMRTIKIPEEDGLLRKWSVLIAIFVTYTAL